jgi:succinyl-diaminopimelate desuccinylase
LKVGALDLLQDEFTKLGFDCTRLPFGAGEKRIDNLFARRGTGGPHFAFAGHTDVVPVGDAAQWQHDPFGGMLVDGKLYGRGAADMKGGIAAFVAAVSALDGA